jgi:hypothetical protein
MIGVSCGFQAGFGKEIYRPDSALVSRHGVRDVTARKAAGTGFLLPEIFRVRNGT